MFARLTNTEVLTDPTISEVTWIYEKEHEGSAEGILRHTESVWSRLSLMQDVWQVTGFSES